MYVQTGPEAAEADSTPKEVQHSLDEVVTNILATDLGLEDAETKILRELTNISKYTCGKITFAMNSVQLKEYFQKLQILDKPQLAPLVVACRAQDQLGDACVQEVA